MKFEPRGPRLVARRRLPEHGPLALKIVYLNTTGTLGGAELCLLDVLSALRASGPRWRPSVVLGEDGPLRRSLAELDVPCDVLPLPGRVARMGDAALRESRAGALRMAARSPAAALATLAYLRRLRRALRRERPDVIQTNG